MATKAYSTQKRVNHRLAHRMFPVRFVLTLFPVIAGCGLAYGGGTNNLTALTNLVTCPGENATFSTVASGALPYTFQWKKDGASLAGRTNNSLTVTNVTAANAGTYSVVLTGGKNSVTNSAVLTLNTPVSASPLANLVRSIGANAIFSTVASGAGPFTYAWKRNGTIISGQTKNSLTFTNLILSDSGTYAVIVADTCGSSVTNSAMLTVATCFPAVDVMLVIDRSGSMTGKPYSDARLACSNFVHNLYMTPNADQAGLASYNSSATLDQKLTNSNPVLEQAIGLIPAAGGFTSISLGLQTAQGELVSSRHHPQALPVLVLLSDGLPTGSDSRSNALFNAAQAKNAGTRIFTVGFGAVDPVLLAGIASSTNDFFYSTSSSQLTALFNAISTIICRPPTNIMVAGPTNQTLCPGLTTSFVVTASGCDPFSYQWRKDGIKLNGQTNASLMVPNVSATNAGLYSVEVTGACRSVTNSATLTVNAPVQVASPLLSRTNCPGGTAVFSVGATGTSLTYQWYNGATPLNGQTGNRLTLTNVNAADAGTYSAVISGACGNSVTNSAGLVLNSPVIVTSPPLNLIACPGTSASFSVGATGTGLSYQWLKNSGVLPGRTSSSLILTDVSGVDQGTYTVIVSGACGSVTNSAALTVSTSVLVVMPPSNQTTVAGSNAVFKVQATGTGLIYRWFFNGQTVGTQSSLGLTNATTNQAGTYCVVISGACGAAATNCATLTVNVPVEVLNPPVNQTNCPGSVAVFSVNSTGTGLSYQWSHDASPLAGQTNGSLILTNVSAVDAGAYRVIVSGAVGGSITNSAILVVNVELVVTAPPLNQTNCPGTTAMFSVSAFGTGLSYQWYKDASILSSKTNSALGLTDVSPADAGAYKVVVNGACGTPATNSATLSVNTVVSASALSSQTNCPGASAAFSTVAGGSGPFSYQWFKNGNVISGQSNSSLTLANVSTGDAGTYSVIVSGACGSVTNSATLNVNTVVSASALSSQTNCPGTATTFSTVASGSGPFSYLWLKKGSALSSQNTNSLTLTNVSASNAGIYSVIVRGACGSVTNSATLKVNTVVSSSALLSQTNCPGTSALFSTVAAGTGPFSYQWLKNGAPINGATANTLSLANLSAADTALYSVLVTGACGSVTNSGRLTVNQNASVAPLASVIRNIGSSVSFTAVASGTGPFTYVWKKNDVVLAGQTSSNLTLTNLLPADGGTYSVEVSGACGNAATSSAVLTIHLPPTVVITNPTNNSVFVAPATFTLLAAASDSDGVVTNVEFFQSTNNVDFAKIGGINVAPYFLVLTNMMTNHYSFIAQAADNLGATGTSEPVNVTVIERPPLTLFGGITFVPQSGMFQLTNVVFNPTYSIFNAVRVYIYGISNPIVVVNATGTTNGVPYIQSAGPILPGTGWTNTIKFFVPVGALTPNPTLVAELVTPAATTVAVTNGTRQHIVRGIFLKDRNFMVEFVTTTNQKYYIQFSSDLKNWTTVHPFIPGNGTTIQWLDAGPPETETLPVLSNTRFYKVISSP